MADGSGGNSGTLMIEENKTSERELYLQSVLDAVNKVQAVIEFEMDGTVITANDNFLNIMGYNLSEIRGQHHSLFVPQEHKISNEYQQFWDNLNRGLFQQAEYKYIGKGGKEVWFQASYNPILDQHGKPFKVVKYATDITVSKNQQAAQMRDIQARISIMNTTSIISEADLKGDITYINDKFCEVSQYTREELIGQPHSFVRHPDMPKDVFKQLWATIGRGQIFRGIIKNRKKDGSPYYVDAVIAPVIGKNGKPEKYIGVRYEITEQEIERQQMKGLLEAIDSAYAYIEFDVQGQVLKANANFLNLMGYHSDEICGKHHRLFVDANYAASNEYAQFWRNLMAGLIQSAVYKLLSKDGREVWIQAVYAPIKDEMGRIYKVVKIATDITTQNLQNADYQGQIEAISKSQAVIEFKMDGTVITANQNFLDALGYSLNEIKGQHHSLFVSQEEKNSLEYRQFWDTLNRGQFQQAEYKRIGKGGREVWIQATYNPILDLNGKPFKVVKFATDISKEKEQVRILLGNVSAAAQGDLTQEITILGEDPIGKIGSGLKILLNDLRKSIGNIAQNANTLGASSEELTAVSQTMSSNAEETSNQSNVVSAAAEQVNRNIEVVASGTEEMTVSIKEIAKNTNEAAKVAVNAVKFANETNKIVNNLGDSSAEIGKVIKVITSIAQQTNLLALNATIEAARAGEAGKGFAVVANEVKELAKETAKATEDISQKIETIQADTQGAVKAIAQISEIINQINDIQTTIATAVDEQAATTNEISRNVVEAAKGSHEIAQNISGVASAAHSTALGSGETQKAAIQLTKMAAELQALVSKFKY